MFEILDGRIDDETREMVALVNNDAVALYQLSRIAALKDDWERAERLRNASYRIQKEERQHDQLDEEQAYKEEREVYYAECEYAPAEG